MVSVLLPFYNAEAWLDECLISIQNQSWTDWECILYNDASQDSGPRLAQQWAESDPRFRLFHNESGLPDLIRAQQACIREARGAYVTRMDADDRMHVQKLEKLRLGQELQNGPALSVGKVAFFGPELGVGTLEYQRWLNERVDRGDFAEHRYRECPVANPCWMLERPLAAQLFEQLQYPEDYDFVLRLYALGIPFRACPEALHHWREHPLRLSKTELYQTERFTQLKWKHFQHQEKAPRMWLLGHGKKAKYARTLMGNSLCGWLSERAHAEGNRLGADRLLHWKNAPILEGDAVLSFLSSLEDWSTLYQALEANGARVYRWA